MKQGNIGFSLDSRAKTRGEKAVFPTGITHRARDLSKPKTETPELTCLDSADGIDLALCQAPSLNEKFVCKGNIRVDTHHLLPDEPVSHGRPPKAPDATEAPGEVWEETSAPVRREPGDAPERELEKSMLNDSL